MGPKEFVSKGNISNILEDATFLLDKWEFIGMYKGQSTKDNLGVPRALRLAILNGCGGAAGNFQIVLCPLYIVLSNINLVSF